MWNRWCDFHEKWQDSVAMTAVSVRDFKVSGLNFKTVWDKLGKETWIWEWFPALLPELLNFGNDWKGQQISPRGKKMTRMTRREKLNWNKWRTGAVACQSSHFLSSSIFGASLVQKPGQKPCHLKEHLPWKSIFVMVSVLVTISYVCIWFQTGVPKAKLSPRGWILVLHLCLPLRSDCLIFKYHFWNFTRQWVADLDPNAKRSLDLDSVFGALYDFELFRRWT